ncbi:MAG: NADH-quinone oxidoreductase subunit L, partial [Chloroflexota bacterium]|nr:NADH-quinone oxidoreductase subunit L [Chloroflexota bacterium]
MSELLLWAWLFTIPGLFLTGLGVGGRPGAPSLFGPPLMAIVALASLAGPPAELIVPGWLPFLPNGAFHLRADSLAAVMLAVVGVVSTCVYVFSLGYMAEEPPAGQRRFFMFLDFFVAAMAILVLAGNLAVLLVGWSGVGLASFLLISFWHDRPGTLGAGLQALAANAIGDAALLIAVVLLPAGCGDLLTLQSATCVAIPGGAATIAWLLLIAAAAKSAQGPLYFWLPSAMAGPTPVSALIHAATMVAAGVYLLVRTYETLALAPAVLIVTAIVGVATAIGGGIASLFQGNFKRGLAYSTVSQLGYMFAAIGFGAPFAAMFHLITHAAFKALLFLTSGVVIHAVHGHEDLAHMGGLRKALPGAHWAFLVGSLSLIGVPAFAGAFSKDAILEAAQSHDPFPPILFFGLFGSVLLTGWYIGRLFFLVFYGPRADHGDLHEPSGLMLWPLVPLALGAIFLGYVAWPVPALQSILGAAVGPAEAVHFPSLLGTVAGLLGLAGFALAYWQARERKVTQPAPTVEEGGWVGAVADVGLGIS